MRASYLPRSTAAIVSACAGLLLLLSGALAASGRTELRGGAAELFRRAQGGRWYAAAAKLDPEILPTSDSRSFVVAWKAPGTRPRRWIVSIHGSRGFATDDLAIWHPTVQGRDVGLLCVQWWIGGDDRPSSYLAPSEIYQEIDLALRRLEATPGSAMLHGFSRGSANSYALAAIDAGRGRRYFSLVVASSGGVALDFPPTKAILAGDYGDHPLRGTNWVTAAGSRDPHPERDGVPAMHRTADWLTAQGAIVLERIEDPEQGHGALQLNPANARRVLDLFLGDGPAR